MSEPLLGQVGQKLSDALYNSIRQEILFCDGAGAGDKILPHEFSRRFNVSPTPVREALMRLASEGFIESIPRRGFRWLKPTRQQIVELWQVRQGLELTAGELAIARLAAGETSADTIDALEGMVEALARDAPHLSSQEQIERNGRIHTTIVELAGNTLLGRTYESIQLKVVANRIRSGVQSWRERNDQDADEHRAIILALSLCDRAAYEAAVRRHLGRSRQSALDDLEATQTD